MRLDSARELKAMLAGTVLASLAEPRVTRALGAPVGPMPRAGTAVSVQPSIALGIVPRSRDGYQLAVRIQRRALEGHAVLEAIRSQARGEVEVRYVGRLMKRNDAPWHQTRVRPLRIGASVGHFKVTAGTLGAFVQARGGGPPLILSNNHVLANENRAKKGDAILQPGRLDRGEAPADVVGTLGTYVRLKRTGANRLDCALATIEAGVHFDAAGLDAGQRLNGTGEVVGKITVHKLGRTTGATRGRVTAIEVDNVVIGYDVGDLRFDQQLEIEGVGEEGFSAGGDSGSLIMDETGRAVALLFAGGDQGGANGKGLTYANPLLPVLQALAVELLP
jgi:hypothetical protein